MFASLPALMVYPVIEFFISYWCFGVIDGSFTNAIAWLGTLILIAITGAFFGFAIGCWIDSPEDAIQLTTLIIMIYASVAGVVVNLNAGNEIVNFLSYFSPLRYGIEIFLRLIL
mmetsp:Transcript_851/g.899  ORF Transcript_851/g.899 Transcript_851/m.899 type:complete len:114 (+) Transcript_851:1545-1886(+)